MIETYIMHVIRSTFTPVCKNVGKFKTKRAYIPIDRGVSENETVYPTKTNLTKGNIYKEM